MSDHLPCTWGAPGRRRRAKRRPSLALAAGKREARGAQRRERVVGDLAGPDQIPERFLELHRLGLAEVSEQVGPERGTRFQPGADRRVERLRRRVALERRRAEPADVVAEVERHAARAAAERAGADPHELAAGAELIEPRGRVAPDAPREHVALPHLGCERKALKRHQLLAQTIDAGPARGRRVHALPCRQQSRERALLGGLDLLAQRGERGAPQPAQHVGVAPLALAAAGAQLALDELAVPLELAQHRPQVHRVAPAEVAPS